MAGSFPPPVPALDVGALHAAAAALSPLGPAVADQGNRTIGAWRQVGTYYLAPETPVLLAALDPVGPLSQRTAERVGGVARALAGWADRIEPVLAELRRLAAVPPPPTPEQVARADALTAELAAAEQDCAGAIRALNAPDFRPPPVRVAERVDKAGVAVIIGFLKVGESAVFKETRFSDGSVSLTAVDAGELGATGTLGGVLEANGGLKIENGSTWRFRTQAEADALRQQLDAYVAQQRAVLFDDTGGAAAGVAIFGGVPAPRPPDQVITEFAIPLSAEAAADGELASGSAKEEFVAKQTQIRDMATGTTTTIVSQENSLTGQVTGTPLGIGPSGSAGGTLLGASTTAVTTDAAGRVTRVMLTSTGSAQGTVADNLTRPETPEGSGGRHRAPGPELAGTITNEGKDARITITTTTLDVTDANRVAVEAWVAAGRPDPGFVTGDPGLHYPDTARPGDAFQNALHDGAKVSRVTYDDATEAYGVDARIKAGWTLGFEAGAEETRTAADGGSYLGAPGPDGTRRPVPVPPPR